MLKWVGWGTEWGRGERRQEANADGLVLPLRRQVCTTSISLSFCNWISFLSQPPVLADAEKLAERFPDK